MISTLIFHSCYFLPTLFKKHKGEIKDSEIEFPEVGKEHYNMAFEKLMEHWTDCIFDNKGKITRDVFKNNMIKNTCTHSCSVNNTN